MNSSFPVLFLWLQNFYCFNKSIFDWIYWTRKCKKNKIAMKTVCVRFTQNVLLNWLIGHTFANIYRLWISQMQTAQKKTFTFCITTRINQWRDFQHLNCLPTLISHIHVCINLYCCFCTVYGQYIISRKCAHSFLIRRQWRHSQWKKSKKKWTYLNDKSAYAIYISNTLTHVRVRVRAFVEPN